MVLTCFLFAQNENIDTMLSLRMDMQSQVEKPLQMRTIAEIRALQENAKTIIVFPTAWCGLYQVELPLLSDSKARVAIPFALEDQIAQPVAHVHFSFDKAHYRNGCYSVVVIDKHLMHEWMAKLSNLDLSYDQITLDWFALRPGEAVLGDESVVVHAETFQGAVSLDVWANCAHDWAQTLQWQSFPESAAVPMGSTVSTHLQSRGVWIAERLCKSKTLNLCQGAFQHATSQTQVKKKYQLAGMLAAAWLISFIGIHAGFYLLITHQLQKVDQQIAHSYRAFFPGAQKVISPKVRIAQLLKQNQSGHNATLWSLLESWSLALQAQGVPLEKQNSKSPLTVQTLQFQNQVLTVMFRCDNFSALERIEAFLQKKLVRVQQISAATENEQVVAKLELSL